MAQALNPRGPDDSGIFVERNAGLAHTRLAIVDPSEAGAQPMTDSGGGWTIAFNGEVYNHLALRRELGGPWRGHSDTETLARALARWGAHALPRCNGPLALAALDRERGRMLLARDRFGKKPLYLAEDDRGVWFASEIRALLAAGLPARPNVELLAHGAIRGWANGPETMIEGITRVRAGSTVSIDLATLDRASASWFESAELVDRELAESLEARPAAELADMLERELDAAVERRLMSDAPVGTMLSGGLDSSLVSTFAARRHPGLVAFHAALPARHRSAETAHARRAAAAAGIPLVEVRTEIDDVLAELVRATWAHEYPLTHAAIIFIRPVAARARDEGVKVLLTGEAADELFAGYDHVHIAETRRFLPPHRVAARGALSLMHHRGAAVRSLLHRTGIRRVPPRAVRVADSAAAARQEELVRAHAAYAHHAPATAELESALLADLRASGLGQLLNRMDKNAMAASVETRVPFLDPAVVRLAVNLPLDLRAGSRPKAIVRELARRHLPRQIAVRSKQVEMGPAVRDEIARRARPEFLEDGVLRETLGDAYSWEALMAPDASLDRLRIWTAEIWARLFLEGRTVAQVEAELWG